MNVAKFSAGEALLWTGKCRQKFVFQSIDFFFVPSLVFWGLGMLIWGGSLLNSAAFMRTTWPNAVLGLVLALIGSYFIFGRFLFESKIRGATYYAVTSDRIPILTLWPYWKITSHNLKQMSEISAHIRKDGREL